MHNLGYHVQGSDLTINQHSKKLANSGIRIFQKHEASNLQNVSYVVISSAIKSNNTELMAAKELNIPVIRRAEMLAELMRLKYSIAVSGSHGKTTTTSLIACLFEAANLDPTVINGGIINSKSANAYLGNSEYLIVEADESDATFIKIPATIGIITNIDAEHMDFYQNFDELQTAFKNFILNLPFYGFAVACIDHSIVRLIIEQINSRKIVTYGIDSEDAQVRAHNIRIEGYHSIFDVDICLDPKCSKVQIIKNVKIPIAGRYNILNSLAAIAVSIEFGVDSEIIKQGLASFEGVKRRFTLVGNYNGADIIDDYAHHPVEIASVLVAAWDIVKSRNGKIIAVFQPHKYSRLESLFQDFVECFVKTTFKIDLVIIMDVFAAGEQAIENINSKYLVQEIKKHHIEVEYLNDEIEIIAKLAKFADAGDIILMMGAGNITDLTHNLPEQLRKFNALTC